MSETAISYDTNTVTYNKANTTAPVKAKSLWSKTVWTNLSMQAKNHGMPAEPYFAPDGLLSREVNVKLWKQIVRPPQAH